MTATSQIDYGAACRVLLDHMRQTRAAYQRGVPGVTYDDMRAAAERVLRMRVSVERASGRQVTTKVTTAAIAHLLRAG
jgi:hypothetical protein